MRNKEDKEMVIGYARSLIKEKTSNIIDGLKQEGECGLQEYLQATYPKEDVESMILHMEHGGRRLIGIIKRDAIKRYGIEVEVNIDNLSVYLT